MMVVSRETSIVSLVSDFSGPTHDSRFTTHEYYKELPYKCKHSLLKISLS